MSRKESRLRNSILNLTASLGGQLLVTIMRFVVRTVFIATLGKEYLGINGYFADIIRMLSLTELGFDTAITFKLYKPLAIKDDQRVRVLLKFYKMAYRAVGCTILILGCCLIPLLPHLIKNYDKLAIIGINVPLVFILFLLQTVCSYLFFAYRSTIMKANQKRYVLDIADYFVTIVNNVVQILVLIFLKNFIIYTATVVIFAILKNLLNAYISQRMYPQFFIPEEKKMDREEIRDLFKDCGALFVYKINGVVLKATDNMVLGAFAGMAVVGLYSNYLLFYTTIKGFVRRLYTAVKASTGNLFAVETMETKYRFFETMNFLTIILYGTAGVGIAVCANELIVAWIGESYLIAQPFPILIGLEILFAGLKQNLGQIRTVTGVFRQAWTRPILSIIINIVASLILVQFWGVYGVIVGTLLADFCTNLMIDPRVIHKYSFENYKPVSAYYKRNILYVGLLIAICAADTWICRHVFVGHGWFSVILHIIIVGVSVPAVFVLVYWRSQECRYLMKLVGNVWKKIKAFINRKK